MNRSEIEYFPVGKLTVSKMRELIKAGIARDAQIVESLDCEGWTMFVDLGDPDEFCAIREDLVVLDRVEGQPKEWPDLEDARLFLRNSGYQGGLLVAFSQA